MKIAYIVPSRLNCAPVFLAKRLGEFFASEGNEIEVFYFDNMPNENELKFSCKTTQIRMNEPLDFSKFDIVHAHMMRPDKFVARHRQQTTNNKQQTTNSKQQSSSARFIVR